jgi:hypothetical protein
MSVARRDDRHNDDLAREISDSFNRAVSAKQPAAEDPAAAGDGESSPAPPRFMVTGDKRDEAQEKRRPR